MKEETSSGNETPLTSGMLRKIKNDLIGSTWKKTDFLENPALPKLVAQLKDRHNDCDADYESAIILSTLAKLGSKFTEKVDISKFITRLAEGVKGTDKRFAQSCFMALEVLFARRTAPFEEAFEEEILRKSAVMAANASPRVQQSILSILTSMCQTSSQREVLVICNAVLVPLLFSSLYKVHVAAMKFFVKLTYNHHDACCAFATAEHLGYPVMKRIESSLSRDQPFEVQANAAECFANLWRAEVIPEKQDVVYRKVMPLLVRCIRSDESSNTEKADACRTLAYCIEKDLCLQHLTQWNNLCPQALGSCLSSAMAVDLSNVKEAVREETINLIDASLRSIAALTSNSEEIRRKVLADVPNLVQQLVRCLEMDDDRILLAALKCYHSLSRSLEQLRTTFQSRSVWQTVANIIRGTKENEIVCVAVAIIANLLLEFSPSKVTGIIESLCFMVHSDYQPLRLNAIWALMNAAYRAEDKVKIAIVVGLNPDKLLHLLTEPLADTLMVPQLMGLVQNLLSQRKYIDYLMTSYGNSVMKMVLFVLEHDFSISVKEQALCILANIADGSTAKEYIMTNEDILRKIANYMMHGNTRFQIAATTCLCNLIRKDDQGFLERQIRLEDLGLQKILQQLLTTNDAFLFEKVKVALQELN